MSLYILQMKPLARGDRSLDIMVVSQKIDSN